MKITTGILATILIAFGGTLLTYCFAFLWFSYSGTSQEQWAVAFVGTLLASMATVCAYDTIKDNQ